MALDGPITAARKIEAATIDIRRNLLFIEIVCEQMMPQNSIDQR